MLLLYETELSYGIMIIVGEVYKKMRVFLDDEKINKQIYNGIVSYLNFANIVKWGSIILSVILAVICFSIEGAEGFGVIILFFGILIAPMLSMMIKWFGYSLKCLYDIRNNTNNNKINNREF